MNNHTYTQIASLTTRPVRVVVTGIGCGGSTAMEQLKRSKVAGLEFIDSDACSMRSSHAHPLDNTDLLFVITDKSLDPDDPVIADLLRAVQTLTFSILIHLGEPRSDTALNHAAPPPPGSCTIGRFHLHDQEAMNMIATLTSILTGNGNVGVELEDIRSIFSNTAHASFSTDTAQGEQCVTTATMIAFDQLLPQGEAIEDANAVLIVVRSDSTPSDTALDSLSRLIQDKCGTHCTHIIHTMQDESLTDQVRVSVIASYD